MLSLITSSTAHLVEDPGVSLRAELKFFTRAVIKMERGLYRLHSADGASSHALPVLPATLVQQKWHPQQLSLEERLSGSEGRLHWRDQQFVVKVL